MSLTNNYGKILQLCDYFKCPCIIYFDDNETHYFTSLQKLINSMLDDSIFDICPDFDTYWINFIGIQHSIFSDEDDLVCIYMI